MAEAMVAKAVANAEPETAASFEADLLNGSLLSFGLCWDSC